MRSDIRSNNGTARRKLTRGVTLVAGFCIAAFSLWQQAQLPSAAPADRVQQEPAGHGKSKAPTAAPRGRSAELPSRRFVDGVRIVDQHGALLYAGRVDLQDTLDRILAGEHYPHRNDGAVFQNRPASGEREPELPKRPAGYYHEYVHPTPGVSGPGPQRVVLGQGGEWYYTPDHYDSFTRLD